MTMVFRRETMIALRARHQAYRIASDMLYPHIDAPPPVPVIPLMTENRGRPARLMKTRQRSIFLLLAAWAAFIVFVIFRAGRG